MRYLFYIFIFFSCFASAQKTASNKPELAKKLLDGFVLDAESRGLEVKQRLSTISKILFLPGARNEHWHQGGICTISINTDVEDEFELIFRTYHEIGHHLSVAHCALCSYNIMAEIKTGKTSYLFSNKAVRQLYLDLFFEQVRNPSNPHKHY